MAVKMYHDEDGKVAILLSANLCPGWSTAKDNKKYGTDLATDERIISLFRNDDYKINKDILIENLEKWGYHNVNIKSWEYLYIEWISTDLFFRIYQDDGLESIDIINLNEWIQAH